MIETKKINQIEKIIRENKKFILTTHLNPDGDALGSEVAMAEYLRYLKKTVHIVNISNTPTNYAFLDENGEFIHFNKEKHAELLQNADVFIILDISDWGRLKEIGEIFRETQAPTICIDHHHINYQFADVDLICEESSSTGELLYEFFERVQFPLTLRAALALYTCILTDTGSFRFSNTTSRTHFVASKLLEHSIDTKEIYSLVYEQNSRTKMALMADALLNLHYECDGKLAWFVLTKEMFEKHNASVWDTEGFPEIPRTIEGVEVSLMFTEIDDADIKISLRSKGKIVINQIAQKFGGGGHHFAAGAQVKKPLEVLVKEVLAELRRVME
ncbi:MAG: bifunctional oligoribonuclease/PAP phosphatase NrnA [Calditrichaeota bacterium]|nr:bifunctional oligoribonuclease/PAP phosphatase NrnA [Calditrichota bacterium]